MFLRSQHHNEVDTLAVGVLLIVLAYFACTGGLVLLHLDGFR